ncbi:MAG TPA: 2-C-methyl-D-erythritol 4-phosphate cytidylyltransferase [Fibrobacteraceae bacterium]|nr:2-C-methyl-D-erythritol 4-phosphate cytidylyltransferase [Fibrobacteraceae bacterium]
MPLNDQSRFGVVLPAGGLGKRMGGTQPKQLLPLQGLPIWQHSLRTFLEHPQISEVVLVVPSDWRTHFKQEAGSSVKIVPGGAERWESVRRGVEALSQEVRWVLVHDVARPLLSLEILDATLTQVRQGPCIVAKPVSDTVKVVRNGLVEQTVDRNQVWLAQTPQACEVSVLRDCYARMDRELLPFVPTDEASIWEHFGIPVHVVPGNTWNDKITTPEDLQRFQAMLAQTSPSA